MNNVPNVREMSSVFSTGASALIAFNTSFETPVSVVVPTQPLVDREAVEKTIRVIAEPGSVVEVRALEARMDRDTRPQTLFGFFDDPAVLADAVSEITAAKGVYFTLNPVDRRLLERAPNVIRPASRGSATQDTDILRYRWLPIDIDPIREPGTSSTSNEQSLATQSRPAIVQYLEKQGWPRPVVANSGNGIHLLYRIDLPVADQWLVQQTVTAIANRFDTRWAKVDRAVCNPARIWRLYGTLACKGLATEDRPHRRSKLMDVPQPLGLVSREYLETVAAQAGELRPSGLIVPAAVASESQPFDVEDFVRTAGFDFEGPLPWTSKEGPGKRWVLRASPMCNHHQGEAYIVQLGNGAVQAGCHHDSCTWTWADLRKRYEKGTATALVAAPPPAEPASVSNTPRDRRLPQVELPGRRGINEVATELGQLLAAKGRYFSRKGSLMSMNIDNAGVATLELVKPEAFPSVIETVCTPTKRTRGSEHQELTICDEAAAKRILASAAFKTALPPILSLTRCPVLVERDSGLVVVTGYDRVSGIYAGGGQPEDMTLQEACQVLLRIVKDFQFASPADLSRALAAFISPALVFGGILLPARTPFTVVEADASQTGKGYFVQLIAAVYNDIPATLTQNDRGGLLKAFDAEIVRGRPFISLDNVRGKFDSRALESFATEPEYRAIINYHDPIPVDPTRTVVFMTSNRAELTTDFANRASTVTLRKQPAMFQFAHYPEGDLLTHVRAQPELFLGAIFSIVKAWHQAGKPCDRVDHDFRRWAGVMNWIVTQPLGLPPLMEGHRETQRRTANKDLTWCRSLAITVADQGGLGQWLRPSDFLPILQQAGDIEIPGCKEGDILEEEESRNSAFRAIGLRLKAACHSSDGVNLGDFHLARRDTTDSKGRKKTEYQFSRASDSLSSP